MEQNKVYWQRQEKWCKLGSLKYLNWPTAHNISNRYLLLHIYVNMTIVYNISNLKYRSKVCLKVAQTNIGCLVNCGCSFKLAINTTNTRILVLSLLRCVNSIYITKNQNNCFQPIKKRADSTIRPNDQTTKRPSRPAFFLLLTVLNRQPVRRCVCAYFSSKVIYLFRVVFNQTLQFKLKDTLCSIFNST